MKMGFNGAGGVGGSSIRRYRRLSQGGGKAKMALDTSGSSGDCREGGAASASVSVSVSVSASGAAAGAGGDGSGSSNGGCVDIGGGGGVNGGGVGGSSI